MASKPGSGSDMLRVELNEGFSQQHLIALSHMLVDHPDTRKRLRALIRKEIKLARNRTAKDVHENLDNDPRKAYRAVKHMVYKSLLGGNISILAARKAGAPRDYHPRRKLDDHPKQRGGNRRKRSKRTEQLDSYFGKDRGFVLRFQNSGTDNRDTRYGNRGHIAPRNIFARAAPLQMEKAAGNIARAFEDEFAKIYNENS